MYPALRYPNFDTVGFLEKEEERKTDLLINVQLFKNTHSFSYLSVYKALWFTYRAQLFFKNKHDWFHIPFSELTSSNFTVTVHILDLCFNFSLTFLYRNRHSIPTSITICKERWRWFKSDANIYSLLTKRPTNILKIRRNTLTCAFFHCTITEHLLTKLC